MPEHNSQQEMVNDPHYLDYRKEYWDKKVNKPNDWDEILDIPNKIEPRPKGDYKGSLPF